jgi:hypothetical protein
MALARVVTFDGVDSEHMARMAAQMREGERPEGLPASELLVLHDPDAERALAIVFFESEEDYRTGDEILDSMPAADTPGRRASVAKYEVAVRMTS